MLIGVFFFVLWLAATFSKMSIYCNFNKKKTCAIDEMTEIEIRIIYILISGRDRQLILLKSEMFALIRVFAIIAFEKNESAKANCVSTSTLPKSFWPI